MLSIKEPNIQVLNKVDAPQICHKNAVQISQDLQKLMLRMKGEFMTDDGRSVDYTALTKSRLFEEYKTHTMELYSVKLEDLNREQKMAFCINIYNALTIHGLAELKQLPKSVLDIQQFWKVTAYHIGGHVFSLDDIEHGILRGNRPHPTSNRPHFPETDPRSKLSLKEVDPRIHFTLVCGAKSCPAINVYSAENLERALDAATMSYCRQEVKVYEIQRKISVSQLFQWYCTDFGHNDVQALRWTVPHVEEAVNKALRNLLYLLEHEGMVDIEYRPYNWQVNATPPQ